MYRAAILGVAILAAAPAASGQSLPDVGGVGGAVDAEQPPAEARRPSHARFATGVGLMASGMVGMGGGLLLVLKGVVDREACSVGRPGPCELPPYEAEMAAGVAFAAANIAAMVVGVYLVSVQRQPEAPARAGARRGWSLDPRFAVGRGGAVVGLNLRF